MKKSLPFAFSLIFALTTAASARTPAEAEAVLLRNMESVGKFLQDAKQCAVSDAQLRGFIDSYEATFRLAEVIGYPSADKLEQAYEKGRAAAKAKPSSPGGCAFLRKNVADLDAGQARTAEAARKYIAGRKN